jgi:glycosyltransferase involved in cell wall biosynthesis
MKKVLIVTYYWPPSGGSGVQRWLKFVRYLRDFGWEPVVYTAENAEYPELDPELEKEIPPGVQVIRTPIWEPYKLYKKFIGQKKEDRVVSGFLNESKKTSRAARISLWIRGNFFIPDARKFWIRPSVKFLSRWLKDNPVDAIVSTGPPHSMHRIALGVKEKTGLPWLADFRDPWTNIDFYHELMLSNRADRIHRRMEKEVLAKADRVVMVGKTWAEELELIGGRKVDVVTNGYDEADIPPGPIKLDSDFTLTYLGMLGKSRNHPILWEGLGELVRSNEALSRHLKVKLVGKTDAGVKEMVEKCGLTAHVEFMGYLRHPDAIKVQASAQVLLLLVNNTPNSKGIQTGKMFEYIAARRPILSIGRHDGDAAGILADTGAGITVDFNDKEDFKGRVLAFFQQWQEGKLNVEGSGYEKYSRKSLTGEMARLLDQMMK